VRRILAATGTGIDALIGNTAVLTALQPGDFTDDRFGVPTVADILAELDKPGRDPRPEFRTATFAADVQTIGDVRPGMVLEGVVTNVAAFGAFVDIGVHQDGLVHVSALADTFVADPRAVVRSGQVVRVKVLEVDPQRKRISLTMRLQDADAQALRDGSGPRGGAADAAGSRAGGQGGRTGQRGQNGRRRSDRSTGGDERGRGTGGQPAPRGDGRRRDPGQGATPRPDAEQGGGSHGGRAGQPGGPGGGGALADALRQAGWHRNS
jgi:uncharacterized protein